jgi:hypothetical protein
MRGVLKLDTENNVRIAYETCVKDAKGIWFPAYDHNGLYFMDQATEKIERIAKIPNEREYAIRLFSCIQRVEDYLILVPFRAKHITMYHITQKKFHQIPLKDTFPEYKYMDRGVKFCFSYVNEEHVYMLPDFYPAIVDLNVRTGEIQYLFDVVKELDERSVLDEPYITGITMDEEGIWVCSGCSPVIVQLNFDATLKEVREIRNGTAGFHGILKNGTVIWLTPRKVGAVLKYEVDTGKEVVYSSYPQGFEAKLIPFRAIFSYQKKLILMAVFANQVLLLDPQTGEMENIEEITQLIQTERKKYTYAVERILYCGMEGETLHFIVGSDYSHIVFDLRTKQWTRKVYELQTEYPNKRLLLQGFDSEQLSGIIFQNQWITLDEYLEYLLTPQEFEIDTKGSKSIGQKILENNCKLSLS